MRPPYVSHRRYSITHRAVQRLRELVLDRDDEDDESLRDRLDQALCAAEDAGKAIRTLDAMLGEPQTLIPVDAFGDVLYAIIKEDTVVTVLPQGHGEEILQRGQAMEQRVATGQASVRPPEREEERWEGPRRRWRKEGGKPVVVERIVRGAGAVASASEPETPVEAPARPIGQVLSLPERPKVEGPVATALHEALELGRRRAAVAALRDVLSQDDPEASLLPLWNALSDQGIPQSMTIGDLIEAASAAAK